MQHVITVAFEFPSEVQVYDFIYLVQYLYSALFTN